MKENKTKKTRTKLAFGSYGRTVARKKKREARKSAKEEENKATV